jgi:hypothetical protein
MKKKKKERESIRPREKRRKGENFSAAPKPFQLTFF